MNKVIESKVGLSDFSWLSPDGKVLVSTNPSYKSEDLVKEDYIQQIINKDEKVISDLRFNSDKSKAFLMVAKGIRVNNKLTGIVAGTLNEEEIKSVFLSKRANNASSYGLIDRNGMIVYRNGSPGIPFEKRKIKADSPAWKALNGEITRVHNYNASVDGSSRMGVNYPIKSIGWACFVTNSVNEQLKPYQQQMRNGIGILIVVFFISLFLAAGLGNHFVKGINKIISVSKEVISGNLSARTNLDGNDEIAIVGQAIDRMTESLSRKVVETEEYGNLKALFLATMSHELKTPLNILLGCIQMIEKLQFNDISTYISSVEKYNKLQKQNCLRLLRLINNLIDINKIEANSFEISLTNGNIVQIVEDITLSVVEYANQKKIDILFDTETEEKIIAFDPDKIERIMLNLLSNAIKFTEPDGVIKVNIYEKADKICISVKDSGIGIPLDKQAAIFERFTQLNNSLTRQSEGSGIGLSLVKSLVEMHKGKITLLSESGKGSEFIVELPTKLEASTNYTGDSKNISSVERIHIEFSDIYF